MVEMRSGIHDGREFAGADGGRVQLGREARLLRLPFCDEAPSWKAESSRTRPTATADWPVAVKLRLKYLLAAGTVTLLLVHAATSVRNAASDSCPRLSAESWDDH